MGDGSRSAKEAPHIWKVGIRETGLPSCLLLDIEVVHVLEVGAGKADSFDRIDERLVIREDRSRGDPGQQLGFLKCGMSFGWMCPDTWRLSREVWGSGT